MTSIRARTNGELAKSNFQFCFRIEVNLHLIGKKMNHQAGILGTITKNQIQGRSTKNTFSVEFSRKSNSIWGVLST